MRQKGLQCPHPPWHLSFGVTRKFWGGTPVFAGTRVPFKNLVDYLAAGDPLERFLEHFPSVTREQAVAALELAGTWLASRANPAR